MVGQLNPFELLAYLTWFPELMVLGAILLPVALLTVVHVFFLCLLVAIDLIDAVMGLFPRKVARRDLCFELTMERPGARTRPLE